MGHVSPTDGKATTISKSIIRLLHEENIIDPIEALACDGTNTNVGAEGGISHLIEVSIGRALQWNVNNNNNNNNWHFPPFWPQPQVLVFSNPPCLAGYMYQMMPSMGFYGSVGVQSTQFRALMTALRTGSRAGTNPCWTGVQTTSQAQSRMITTEQD